MHNFTVWNATHSTEGFIRVSDAIYGEQREQMKKIEEFDKKSLITEVEDIFNHYYNVEYLGSEMMDYIQKMKH